MVVNGVLYAIFGGYAVLQLIEKMTGRHLTVAEEFWCIKNPCDAYKIGQCASQAFDEERSIFFENSDDDEGDAFRHCFWSALIARECGRHVSGVVTSLHEQLDADPVYGHGGNPILRRNMDLANNGVGRLRVHMGDNKNMSRQVL